MGACGLLFTYFVLRESHPKLRNQSRKHKKNKNDKNDDQNSNNNCDDPNQNPTPLRDELLLIHRASMLNDIQLMHSRYFGLPNQMWILGFVNICAMLTWTSYTSMFAYYVVDKWNVSTLGVGYITLTLALVYVASTAIIFSQLTKKIGVYYTALIGSGILAILLGIFPLFDNIWIALTCLVLGYGVGNGIAYPGLTAVAADLSNPKNRGRVLAFNNSTLDIGRVIGPMLHGFVYDYSRDLVFYQSSVFIIIGGMVLVLLMIKNPHLVQKSISKAKSNDKKDDDDNDNDGNNEENDNEASILSAKDIKVNEKDWKFVRDEPKDSDFKRLGKDFGTFLIDRNYNWVTHYDRFRCVLEELFPVVRTETLNEYVEDLKLVKHKIQDARVEFEGIRDGASGVQYS